MKNKRNQNPNSKIQTLNSNSKSHNSELTTHHPFHHSGITLIALVVTVVVLLILAGVSLTLILGDNNIFKLAKEAGDKTNEAIKSEQSQIDELNKWLTENGYGSSDEDLEGETSIYAFLYDDGTLSIGSKNEGIQGKIVTKSYGDIGTIPKWLEDAQNITTVVIKEQIYPTNTSGWFEQCENLTSIENIENLKTNKVTNMVGMFNCCRKLENLDLSHFDTSNVTNMGFMFQWCTSLKSLDVSNFDTSKVTSMASMFFHCESLTTLDLSGFDTSKITEMYDTFYYCTSLKELNVSNFNTSNVTNMSSTFGGCKELTTLDLSSFDTRNVTDMDRTFINCSKLSTIYVGNNWIIGENTKKSAMFWGCLTSNTTLKQ